MPDNIKDESHAHTLESLGKIFSTGDRSAVIAEIELSQRAKKPPYTLLHACARLGQDRLMAGLLQMIENFNVAATVKILRAVGHDDTIQKLDTTMARRLKEWLPDYYQMPSDDEDEALLRDPTAKLNDNQTKTERDNKAAEKDDTKTVQDEPPLSEAELALRSLKIACGERPIDLASDTTLGCLKRFHRHQEIIKDLFVYIVQANSIPKLNPAHEDTKQLKRYQQSFAAHAKKIKAGHSKGSICHDIAAYNMETTCALLPFIPPKERELLVNCVNKSSLSPLQMALSHNHLSIAEAFYIHGAKVEMSLLFWAQIQPNRSIIMPWVVSKMPTLTVLHQGLEALDMHHDDTQLRKMALTENAAVLCERFNATSTLRALILLPLQYNAKALRVHLMQIRRYRIHDRLNVYHASQQGMLPIQLFVPDGMPPRINDVVLFTEPTSSAVMVPYHYGFLEYFFGYWHFDRCFDMRYPASITDQEAVNAQKMFLQMYPKGGWCHQVASEGYYYLLDLLETLRHKKYLLVDKNDAGLIPLQLALLENHWRCAQKLYHYGTPITDSLLTWAKGTHDAQILAWCESRAGIAWQIKQAFTPGKDAISQQTPPAMHSETSQGIQEKPPGVKL